METDSGSRRLLPLFTVMILIVTAGWVTAADNLNLDADSTIDSDADVGTDAGPDVSADVDTGADDEAARLDADPNTPGTGDATTPTVEPVDVPTVDAPGTDAPSVSVPAPETDVQGTLQDVEGQHAATTAVGEHVRSALSDRSIDLELALDEGIVLDPSIVPLLDLSPAPTASLHAGAQVDATVEFVKTTQRDLGAAAFGKSAAAPASDPSEPTMRFATSGSASGVAYDGPLSTSSPALAPADGGSAPPQVGATNGEGSSSATVQSRTSTLPETLLHQGTTAALAAAAAGLVPYLAWVLYHRIRGHAVLNNPTRKTIYDRVCEEPGLGVKELADAADVSYSTASYHLDRLRDADMIVVNRDGNRLSFYQNGGAFSEEERELLPLLQNCEAMRVLEDILDHPGTYRARIAERLGVTATTINWHLKNLLETGLVEERREGRTAHLFVPRTRLEEDVLPLLEKAPSEKMEWANPVAKIKASLGKAAPA